MDLNLTVYVRNVISFFFPSFINKNSGEILLFGTFLAKNSIWLIFHCKSAIWAKLSVRDMFKDHIIVAEELSRNPDECRGDFCALCSESRAVTSVHALFCVGVNEPSRFPLSSSSKVLSCPPGSERLAYGPASACRKQTLQFMYAWNIKSWAPVYTVQPDVNSRPSWQPQNIPLLAWPIRGCQVAGSANHCIGQWRLDQTTWLTGHSSMAFWSEMSSVYVHRTLFFILTSLIKGSKLDTFCPKAVCTVTLNSNFAILKTWNCFQLE